MCVFFEINRWHPKMLASSSKRGCLGTKKGSQVAVGSSPTSPAEPAKVATEKNVVSTCCETCGQNGEERRNLGKQQNSMEKILCFFHLNKHGWLVVYLPSEKWWTESQLGWFSIPNWIRKVIPSIPWFRTTNQMEMKKCELWCLVCSWGDCHGYHYGNNLHKFGCGALHKFGNISTKSNCTPKWFLCPRYLTTYKWESTFSIVGINLSMWFPYVKMLWKLEHTVDGCEILHHQKDGEETL